MVIDSTKLRQWTVQCLHVKFDQTHLVLATTATTTTTSKWQASTAEKLQFFRVFRAFTWIRSFEKDGGSCQSGGRFSGKLGARGRGRDGPSRPRHRHVFRSTPVGMISVTVTNLYNCQLVFLLRIKRTDQGRYKLNSGAKTHFWSQLSFESKTS